MLPKERQGHLLEWVFLFRLLPSLIINSKVTLLSLISRCYTHFPKQKSPLARAFKWDKTDPFGMSGWGWLMGFNGYFELID